MTTESLSDLRTAVERLHNCRASFRESAVIHEKFGDQMVWDGVVQIFAVDLPETDTCYAWSSLIEGSDRRKFYAVLHIPPVDSPEKAVRAAIVAEHRQQ